jgi:hypothetical protein
MFCLNDVLFLLTFCPYRHLSPWTFGPLDVLSLRMFCPSGRFVPQDVMSHRRYVSSHYVSGHYVSRHSSLRTFCLGTIYLQPNLL